MYYLPGRNYGLACSKKMRKSFFLGFSRAVPDILSATTRKEVGTKLVFFCYLFF